jgi:hypothetical protein
VDEVAVRQGVCHQVEEVVDDHQICHYLVVAVAC